MGISVGNKIELVMLDDIIRNEKNKKVYVSKIFDILQGNKLQIAMPIYEGKIVPLSVSDKYSACFYTDKGLMQCNVIVTARYKEGHMFFLEVLILGQLEKVQRRQFYRYICKLGAKVRVVSDEEYETGVPDVEVISEDDLESYIFDGTTVTQMAQKYISINNQEPIFIGDMCKDTILDISLKSVGNNGDLVADFQVKNEVYFCETRYYVNGKTNKLEGFTIVVHDIGGNNNK